MIFAVTYGVGAITFAGLLVLIVLGRQAQGAGRNFVLACGVTLIWTCAAAISHWRAAGVAQALEVGRDLGWLYFLAAALGAAGGIDADRSQRFLRIAPLVLG